MSVRIMDLVFNSTLSSMEKMAMLAIADNANDEGVCFPSVERLAKKTGMSRPGFTRIKKRLLESGVLAQTSRSSHEGRKTNIYQINIEYLFNTQHPDLVRNWTRKTSGNVTKGYTAQCNPESLQCNPESLQCNPGLPKPSDNHQLLNHQYIADKPKNTQKRKKPKTPLRENFDISEGVREWALKNNHQNLEQHLDAFKLLAESNGYTYVNWDSAFKRAIREDWAKLNGRQKSNAEQFHDTLKSYARGDIDAVCAFPSDIWPQVGESVPERRTAENSVVRMGERSVWANRR